MNDTKNKPDEKDDERKRGAAGGLCARCRFALMTEEEYWQNVNECHALAPDEEWKDRQPKWQKSITSTCYCTHPIIGAASNGEGLREARRFSSPIIRCDGFQTRVVPRADQP